MLEALEYAGAFFILGAGALYIYYKLKTGNEDK